MRTARSRASLSESTCGVAGTRRHEKAETANRPRSARRRTLSMARLLPFPQGLARGALTPRHRSALVTQRVLIPARRSLLFMLSTETRTRFLPTVSRLRRRPLLVHILLLILLLVLSGLYGVYLGADRSWDLLNYHYYIPYAFLHARLGFDIQPAPAQTYLNPLLDLPFYVLIRQFNDYPRFVGFVQGATNGVGLYCIVVLAWRLLGRVAGLSTSA